MSDSVRPCRRQLTRLPRPWDSPGKNTEVGCHFLLQCMKVKSESEVAQLCPTLSDPMDCSLPGSSVHGIFQARVLEWGTIAFSEAITSILFFFFNFYFLTLQYCIGFAIYQHESATGIHLFLILNPLPSLHHPSRSFQCTSPKHPASCIEPGLASRFTHNIIHVSMPFSQIIPPSPSPTESERLFYTSVKTAFYKIL